MWPNARPPSGITTSATWLADGEVVSLSGLPTTTLTRTAFERGTSGRQYYLDLGWEDLKIAVEYDGDHHRSDKRTFGYDIVRLEEIASLGWIVIRVVAGTPRDEVVRRVRAAWAARTPSTLR